MNLNNFSIFFLSALSLIMIGCGQADKTKKKAHKIPTISLKLQNIDMPQVYVADIQGIQFMEIKPIIEGRIEEIFVDEGKKVKIGDKLFQLSSPSLNEHVKESEAAFKQAEVEYQMAVYEQSRITRLVDKNIISSIRLEQVKAELEVAKLKVTQAKAQYHRELTNLSYTIINAPISGYIDRIPYKKGSLVDQETLLTTLSDVSEVFAYYKMNESDYLKYKRALLNGEATHKTDDIELTLPDDSIYEHRGKVETIEGDFDRRTGSIAFRARFPNPEGLLRHGVTGKISMTTQMKNVYLIPQQSTFEVLEFTYVYIVDKDGVARIRNFEPLGRYKDFYVAQDFEPNTQIVYSGIQSVKDGMKITPEKISLTLK